MPPTQQPHIWKVRTIKNYPEAHNHILVGKVLDVTTSYIRLHCRTYHYGRMMNKPEDVKIGSLMTRVVPWSRVEIINELPPAFNYVKSVLVAMDEGQVFFSDGANAEPVGSGGKYEVRY